MRIRAKPSLNFSGETALNAMQMIRYLAIIWLAVFGIAGALGCENHSSSHAQPTAVLQQAKDATEAEQSGNAQCGHAGCDCRSEASCPHSSVPCICGCGHGLPQKPATPATSVSRNDSGKVAGVAAARINAAASGAGADPVQTSLRFVISGATPLFLLHRSIRT